MPLPSSPQVALTPPQITQTLKTLFTWPVATVKFATYFQMLPKKLPIMSEAQKAMAGVAQGQRYFYDPYGVGPATGITLRIDPALSVLPSFQSNTGNEIFVTPHGFTQDLPIVAAELLAAGFANGLVTRLLLGEYVRLWAGEGGTATIAKLPFPDQPQLSSLYSSPQTYGKAAAGAFLDVVGPLLLSDPVLPAGILLGWSAADELDTLTDDLDRVKYSGAVGNLIKSRFSYKQIGELVGFTFNYVIGYLKTQRIQTLGQYPAPNQDNGAILAFLAADPGIADAGNILTTFYNYFLSEFYAISINTAPSVEKPGLLSVYSDFLSGFNSGCMRAANDVFILDFDIAYGLGYSDGFRHGYAQGYAAGYRDGYAQGYADAWTKASVIIAQLQAQVAQLQGDNNFWNDLSTVGNVLQSVLGVVSIAEAVAA